MITTSRGFIFLLVPGADPAGSLSRVSSDPEERAHEHEDSAHCQPSRPHVALLDDDDDPEDSDEGEHQRRNRDQCREQPENNYADDRVRGLDRSVAQSRGGTVDEIGGVSCPVAHGGAPGRAAYPEAGGRSRAYGPSTRWA